MTALAQALSVLPVDTRRKMSPGDKEKKKKTGSATFFASEAASLSAHTLPFAHTHTPSAPLHSHSLSVSSPGHEERAENGGEEDGSPESGSS